MITDYMIFAAGQIWPVLLVPFFSTIIYYCYSKENRSIRKLLVSMGGLILLGAFVYALLVSKFTENGPWDNWIIPFWILLICFVLLNIYSLVRFNGNKWFHLTQVALLPSAFLIWLVGTMTITHDWL